MPDSPQGRRDHWVSELAQLSDSFGSDTTKVLHQLQLEIASDGNDSVLDHLRFCGAIPECYGHDSSEEKLYSKYTDTVVSEAFTAMGLNSVVIENRADSADVQATAGSFSLIADAKAFRLSRTAKNQKDFKIQALDSWRNGLDFAILVAPIYQLPTRKSQIYLQAINHNVCILSYSHVAALVNLSFAEGKTIATESLHQLLLSVQRLHPSQDAVDYWTGINRSLVTSLGSSAELWTVEKKASEESLAMVKHESIRYLTLETDRLLKLAHAEALQELIKTRGIEARIKQVNSVVHGSLLGT